jgi:asparagine synthase (glutamine-hydrolysing)
MSGIAGSFRIDGHAADRQQVRLMAESMAHRGPDGSAVWCDGPVGLAHLMLRTTPESLHESQPLVGRGGAAVLTADARIDNRDELLRQLVLLPAGALVTDADLIMAAWERWGQECVDHLIGDFVFAIWDVRTHQLFCARDHLGVKPLFFTEVPGRLIAFASEIKALLALSQVPERLNEVRLGDYLGNQGRTDTAITAFDGILRLPPASTLVATRDGTAIRRYWRPTLPPPQPVRTDAEYAGEFRRLFTEAVRCRVRSAFPVASEFSGGLDSTYVTCVARDLMRDGDQALHSISLVFDVTPECDERPYINTVLEQGGMTPHLIAGDGSGPLSHLPEIFEYLDDGFTGGNHHMIWECCRTARDVGARVLLDGVDGDTVVWHGLERFAELAHAGDWKTFAHEMRAAEAVMRRTQDKQSFHEVLGDPAKLLKSYAFPVVRELAESGQAMALLRALLGMRRHLPIRFLNLLKLYGRRLVAAKRGRLTPTVEEGPSTTHLDPDFVARCGLEQRFAATPMPKESTARGAQRALLESDVFAHSFEVLDHYAAAHGLELRHPFMDKRLVEFCLGLPTAQSLANGLTRVVMRNAMDATVPDMIRLRPGKTTMAAAFDYGFFEIDGEVLRDALAPGGPLDAYVRREHLDEYLEKGRDLPGRDIWMLCLFATLSLWMRGRSFVSPPPDGATWRTSADDPSRAWVCEAPATA